jgi:phage terminase large subunit-like protein
MTTAKAELLQLLAERERRIRTRMLDTMYPETGALRRELYAKHMEFFKAGAKYRERCMMAANRVGKSYGAGGYETALHLTGLYPSWWQGRRFNHPISAWAAGESSKTTRDTIQKILLGEHRQHGTGLIPGDLIVGKPTPKPGIADGIEDIYVKHVSGGTSHIGLKSYEQGAGSFMGTERHLIWLDEEPPLDVYTEALTRTMIVPGATPAEKVTGMLLATFTPLNGLSDVVMNFMPDGRIDGKGADEKFIIQVTWDEVPHLTLEMKEGLWKSLPPHERSARSKGTPQLGAGAIYPISEEEIIVQPFEIPPHWPRGYAMDVGWNKTAAAWFAHDRESGRWYLYSEHYQGEAVPAVHAEAIKARGVWMRGVIDPASRGRSQKDGEKLFYTYLNLGLKLNMAVNAVEAGIYEVWQLLSTGRLKVFSTCVNWLSEFRIYRRDKHGKPVKKNDHLMDTTRYFVMSGVQLAITEPRYDEEEEYFEEAGKSKVCGY